MRNVAVCLLLGGQSDVQLMFFLVDIIIAPPTTAEFRVKLLSEILIDAGALSDMPLRTMHMAPPPPG